MMKAKDFVHDRRGGEFSEEQLLDGGPRMALVNKFVLNPAAICLVNTAMKQHQFPYRAVVISCLHVVIHSFEITVWVTQSVTFIAGIARAE